MESEATTSAAPAADPVRAARDAGVRAVELQFTDVLGALKSVIVPADQLGDALAHGCWFDGSSVEGPARTAESDMYLRPDPVTFRIDRTGDEPQGRIICWVTRPDGEPYPGDPRAALQRALDQAAGLGYDYRVGPELEFYLLERGASGGVEPLGHDHAGYFDAGGANELRDSLLRSLLDSGVAVNSLHHEVAAGQHEIDLAPAGALHCADEIVTARQVLRQVAQRHGVLATFMPKPFNHLPGSGLHIHQSLVRRSDEANALRGADDYGLSDVAKHFIAGQLHHAAGMSLVLASLVNSYKRLVRGFEAPIFVSWARTNRGALLRVPEVARPETARVELRSPDSSCNPYLALAVMLRCGLDGIERRLALPPPVEEALYGFDDVELERRNVAVLPDNLHAAMEAFAADDVVRDAVGDHLAERLLEAKELEWRDYRGQVTSWELEQYLER